MALTLNRPKEMNCMNFEMIQTLEEIIRETLYAKMKKIS